MNDITMPRNNLEWLAHYINNVTSILVSEQGRKIEVKDNFASYQDMIECDEIDQEQQNNEEV